MTLLLYFYTIYIILNYSNPLTIQLKIRLCWEFSRWKKRKMGDTDVKDLRVGFGKQNKELWYKQYLQ